MRIYGFRNRVGLSAIALVSGALLLGGCGGSSPTSPTGTAAQAPHGSEIASSSGGVVAAGVAGHSNATSGSSRPTGVPAAHKDPIATGGNVVQHSPPSREKSLEGKSGEAPVQDPCELLTRSEVSAAVGDPIVSRTVAPLGPTCIFKLRGKRPAVTLTVERMSISKLGSQFKGAQKLAIADHQGLCGKLGRQTLFVSVGNGEVLNITAPCAAAKALATRAIGRVES
jgi:hypothetical protein